MRNLVFVAVVMLFALSSCINNTGIKPKINAVDTAFTKGIQATFNGVTENFKTNDSAQYFNHRITMPLT